MISKTAEVKLTIESQYGTYELSYEYYIICEAKKLTGEVPPESIDPIILLIEKTKGTVKKADMGPVLMKSAVSIGQCLFKEGSGMVFPIRLQVGDYTVYQAKCVDKIMQHVTSGQENKD